MKCWPNRRSDGGASSLSCGELIPAGRSPNNGSIHTNCGKPPLADALNPFDGSEYSRTFTMSNEYLVNARIMLSRCWKYTQLTPRAPSRSNSVATSDGVKVV